jgi:aryl-alcohol dehydrogenase-like predicted oxidoreductase
MLPLMLRQIQIPHSPLMLSAMALGAGAFGPRMTANATDLLYEEFRGAGGTCFDTAHCYSFWLPGGAGSAERSLGACIRRHADRRNVTIITKGGHPAVPPDYPRPDAYLGPERIAQDIAESLENLGTDTIDVFLLHRDDPRVPVGEIIDMLDVHVAAGRLRAYGASNWSVERLEAANAYTRAHGRSGMVISEPQFSLGCYNAPRPKGDPAMRYLDDGDLAWHTRSGLPVLCYGPTAHGYFASGGKLGRKAYENATSRGRLVRAQQLAAELGTTPNQIALAYVCAQPFTAIPILGTANTAHLADALAAADVVLTPAQVRWLTDPACTTNPTAD